MRVHTIINVNSIFPPGNFTASDLVSVELAVGVAVSTLVVVVLVSLDSVAGGTVGYALLGHPAELNSEVT